MFIDQWIYLRIDMNTLAVVEMAQNKACFKRLKNNLHQCDTQFDVDLTNTHKQLIGAEADREQCR